MLQGFGLSGCICQKGYVIGVVCVRKSFCGVSSGSFFANVNPFSFTKSIEVLRTESRQIINRYGANVSFCSTPATMTK